MPYREYSYFKSDPTVDLVLTLKMRILDLEEQVKQMQSKIAEIDGRWSEPS